MTDHLCPLRPARRLLFWFCNIIFAIFLFFGLIPLAWSKSADLAAAMPYALAMLVSVAGSIFLGRIHLVDDHKKLYQLFLMVELPTFVPPLFMLLNLKPLSPAGFCLWALLNLASAYQLARIFGKTRNGSPLDLAGAALSMWCGAWICILLIFFIPPILMVTASAFAVYTGFMFGLTILLTAVFMVPHIFKAVCLLLFSPFIYTCYACANFYRALSAALPNGKIKAAAMAVLVPAAATLVLAVPHARNNDFILNKYDYSNLSDADKAEITKNEKYYRSLLTGIYLSPLKGGETGLCSLQQIYSNAFGVDAASTESIQRIFDFVSAPIEPRGLAHNFVWKHLRAEELYKKLFDAKIQEDEREAIRRAYSYRHIANGRDAGLLNIDKEVVYLQKQELNLTEQGEWADIMLHEVYSNTSARAEETAVYFNLPEGAVITGLWLGENEKEKFAANVAPRGAARKVYKAIVARGEDPALLEQVGPRMYRLRVYPIPGNGISPEKRVMHIWLSIRAVKQNDKTWGMPHMVEKRNLFWNAGTAYTQNGVAMPKNRAWLPASLPASPSKPVEARLRAGGYSVVATPHNKAIPACDKGLNVLIDTSYSMNARAKALHKALAGINDACGENVNYYAWNKGWEKIEGDPSAQIKKRILWGSLNAHELADGFSEIAADGRYTLVLTDKTLFGEKADAHNYKPFTGPVWFLLLDGQMPRSIDDNLLKNILLAGGGLETGLEKALAAMAWHNLASATPGAVEVDGRYIWKIFKEQDAENTDAKAQGTENANKPDQLAAHKLISYAARMAPADGTPDLDRLHAVAAQARIVSPYSSMLALVSDWQREMLNRAEKDANRFEREAEQEQKDLTPAIRENGMFRPFVANAVPEPHEWAMIFAAILLLLAHVRGRRSSFFSS